MSMIPFDFDDRIKEYERRNGELVGTLPTYDMSPTLKNIYAMISPFSNTGLKLKQQQAKDILKKTYKDYPVLFTETVVTDDGVMPIAIRRPANTEVCVTDWLTFTIRTRTFESPMLKKLDEDSKHDYIIRQLSKVLEDIFGFAIIPIPKNGRNFYTKSYYLEHDAGFVCIGGQNETISISINGTGCTYGNYGWEADLYAWLNLFAIRPKITRIDLAYDDLTGETISVDWANAQDDLGGFNCGGKNPNVEQKGNWKRPTGRGRSLYIGSRASSKYCRFYEKGKHEGDSDSPWVRCEVELKNKHLYIPLDVLISSSQFFLALYPCFHVFDSQENSIKFERIKRKQRISYNKAKAITRHQFGRYLFAFRDIYQDDSKLLDDLMPDNLSYPDRLDTLTIPIDQYLNPAETEQMLC